MTKQYLVVGLGRFGSSVAQALYEAGHTVMAVDTDPERLDDMRGKVTHTVQCDMTDPDAVAELGVSSFDAAIVSIGTDIRADSVATMLLKDAGVPRVIAKAGDEMHGRLLMKVGADRVVYPERDMGRRLAQGVMWGNLMDFVQLSDEYSLFELRAPAEWSGKTLAQLALRTEYGVNVAAVSRDGAMNPLPGGDDEIREDDVLVVVASNKGMERLKKRFRTM